MYFSACRGKRGGSRIQASEAQHLMPGIDEFSNDGGANKASSPGDKNTHKLFSFQPVRVARIAGNNLDELFSICYKRRQPPYIALRLTGAASGCKKFSSWLRKRLKLQTENHARTRNAIANVFSKWRNRSSRESARTPALRTSPRRRA